MADTGIGFQLLNLYMPVRLFLKENSCASILKIITNRNKPGLSAFNSKSQRILNEKSLVVNSDQFLFPSFTKYMLDILLRMPPR